MNSDCERSSLVEKYNYLINENNQRVPDTMFYFYPLDLSDYYNYYKNVTITSYPLMAFIYLTHRCHDRCVGCFVQNITDPAADLDWQVIKSLLYSLKQGGTKAVKFAGREPSVSPHLGRTLELSSELGLKSLLITSGANIDQHSESISKYCTHLRVSLNTISEEEHNVLHRPSKRALPFSVRLRVLENILKERNATGKVSGSTFLIRSQTIDYAVEYAQMCKQLGFNYVRFTTLDEAKGKSEHMLTKLYEKLHLEETSSFAIFLHDGLPEKNYLDYNFSFHPLLTDPAITTRVTIHANGDVNACQEGWRSNWGDYTATFGNLNEQSFDAIWTGEKRISFVKHITETFASNCVPQGCSSCKYSDFNYLQKWIAHEATKLEANGIVKVSL